MKFPKISEYPVISLDVETTGLSWWRDRMFGVAISTPDGRDYYFDTRIDEGCIRWLREEVPKCALVVNHNIGFDLHMLWNEDIWLDPARCECTMIRAALIDEHLPSYSLDKLAKKYLGARKQDDIYEKLAELFGGRATRNVQMKNIPRAPKSVVEPYATVDSRLALNLWKWQEERIEKRDLSRVWQLEKRLFPHVFKMERHGIRVDTVSILFYQRYIPMRILL